MGFNKMWSRDEEEDKLCYLTIRKAQEDFGGIEFLINYYEPTDDLTAKEVYDNYKAEYMTALALREKEGPFNEPQDPKVNSVTVRLDWDEITKIESKIKMRQDETLRDAQRRAMYMYAKTRDFLSGAVDVTETGQNKKIPKEPKLVKIEVAEEDGVVSGEVEEEIINRIL